MPAALSLDELAALNPGIDKDQIKETSERLKELRQRGIRRRGYHLATPLTRRRGTAQRSESLSPQSAPTNRHR